MGMNLWIYMVIICRNKSCVFSSFVFATCVVMNVRLRNETSVGAVTCFLVHSPHGELRDPTQDITVLNHLVIGLSRLVSFSPLYTGDINFHIIHFDDSTVDIIWAHGNTSGSFILEYHGNSHRGVVLGLPWQETEDCTDRFSNHGSGHFRFLLKSLLATPRRFYIPQNTGTLSPSISPTAECIKTIPFQYIFGWNQG